ncbi:MAG: hypothetical protein WCY92_06045 [Novosphingobium sp.]
MKRGFLSILSLVVVAGCNSAQNAAVGACEAFIKERLRSPSTYKQIGVDYSGVSFKSEGRDVRMVTVEYDAANAFGTPIRGNQQCVFEVDKSGNFAENPDHAARMAAIDADEYSPCCLLDDDQKLSNKSEADILKEAEVAVNAAKDAARAAGKAAE